MMYEENQKVYYQLRGSIQNNRCILTGYGAVEGGQDECKKVYHAVMDTLKVESAVLQTGTTPWTPDVTETEEYQPEETGYIDVPEETSDIEPLGEMSQREYLGEGCYELQIPRWNLALTYPDYMEISENIFDGRVTLIDMNYFLAVEDIYAKWINSTLDADSFLQQYMEATVFDYVPIMFGDVIEFYNYKNQGGRGGYSGPHELDH